MASISPLSQAERLERRRDLVVRPLPEISMFMVYRPRPARIISLNPSSWMLLTACDGATVGEIEESYAAMLAGKGRVAQPDEARNGLQALVDLSLVKVCEARGIDDDEL
jgi:hypothetical protein